MAIDDATTMKRLGGRAVTDAAHPAQYKAAVDAVHHRLTPDYLMLLGSTDVIPHQPLRNPVHDGVNDVDELVPSDLPYACNAPFSDDPTDFIGPDRVVGRLPGQRRRPGSQGVGESSWRRRPRGDQATAPEHFRGASRDHG